MADRVRAISLILVTRDDEAVDMLLEFSNSQTKELRAAAEHVLRERSHHVDRRQPTAH